MPPLGVRTNNPLDLTVGRNVPGRILYSGQSGTVQGPNGLTFAQFPSADAGIQAGNTYVARHGVGQTLGTLLQRFGAPSSANADNPSPTSYAGVASRVSGLGLNQTITQADIPNVVRGISAAEGTASGFPQLGGNSGATGLDLGGDHGLSVGSGGSSSSSSGSNPLSFLASFFSLNTGERILATIMGLTLISIAVIVLLSKSPVVQAAAKNLSTVALAAA